MLITVTRWGFPKMVGLPNKPMGFPTENDHFRVFWGYHHLRKPPDGYIAICSTFSSNFPSNLRITNPQLLTEYNQRYQKTSHV